MSLQSEAIKYLVVHCSATKPNQFIGAHEIDLWHKDRGWSGIGYHYVIRRDVNNVGSYLERGRPLNIIGAHVLGYNTSSIGICMVGGLDDIGNPDANYNQYQYDNLFWTLKYLSALFPNTQIIGHRDFPEVAKACPCFDVKSWWKSITIQLGIPRGIDSGDNWSK